MHTELTAMAASGALVSIGVEWIKRRSWVPWINGQTERVNRAVTAMLAALAAIGVQVTFDPDTGVLVIAGLTWATASAFLHDWALTWLAAKGYYRLLLKPNGG